MLKYEINKEAFGLGFNQGISFILYELTSYLIKLFFLHI